MKPSIQRRTRKLKQPKPLPPGPPYYWVAFYTVHKLDKEKEKAIRSKSTMHLHIVKGVREREQRCGWYKCETDSVPELLGIIKAEAYNLTDNFERAEVFSMRRISKAKYDRLNRQKDAELRAVPELKKEPPADPELFTSERKKRTRKKKTTTTNEHEDLRSMEVPANNDASRANAEANSSTQGTASADQAATEEPSETGQRGQIPSRGGEGATPESVPIGH